MPLIRIDTNQGISGFGEVRDGGSARYALFFKIRLKGSRVGIVNKNLMHLDNGDVSIINRLI